MTYIFDATPENAMKGFFLDIADSIEADKSGDLSGARTQFEEALSFLIDLEINRIQSKIDDTTLQEFIKDSCPELLKVERYLGAHGDIVIYRAEAAREDPDWYKLCIQRSVIQLLIQYYSNTPCGKYLEYYDLDTLDNEMRRVGEDQGPVPEKYVPKLPSSHWWWTYPTLIS